MRSLNEVDGFISPHLQHCKTEKTWPEIMVAEIAIAIRWKHDLTHHFKSKCHNSIW